MGQLTAYEERRLREIIRDRHSKSYTFKNAAWFSEPGIFGRETADFYIVSNKRTGFSLWRSLDKNGRSIRPASICVYRLADPNEADHLIYGAVAYAVEQRIL